MTPVQSTELPFHESNDDKQFRKYILRRNNEDSIDDSRDNDAGKAKSISKKAILHNPLKLLKKRSSFAPNMNTSPRKAESNPFLRQATESVVVIRSPQRAVGRSIIYGDKIDKKQAKGTHPLSIFVGLFHFREMLTS
jgi:hypothetical protein